MPVPINPPIIVPGVTQTFDVWFFRDFHASGLTQTEGVLTFTKVPMSSATGAFLEPGAITVTVPFWQAVSEVPGAAEAMQATLAVLPAIQAHFTQS